MRSRRLVFGTAAALVMAILLSDVTTAGAQKRGGTLRVAYGNEISNLDFHTAPGYELVWAVLNMNCGLISMTPDGKFVPDAAESWQISPDGLLYTFKLKKNVLFHDGTRLDASVVKFNVDRIMDPATRSSMRTFYEPVHSVEVLDPYTVQIRLKHPYAFMLHMLAVYRMGLMFYSPAATQKYTIEDRKAGKPEAVPGRGPHPIFNDIRVRKAVGCYGIDRKEIVKIAFKGQATPWLGIIPPGTQDTVDVTHMCPYDPARAKALLAEAGYGPQKPLTFELMTNTEKSVFNVIATVIKEQVARIGVTANIRLVDKVTWMNVATQDGPFDMYVEDLASLFTLDQNTLLSHSTAAWNTTRHTDTRIDDYYARYAREMDPAKRKVIAREFQEFSADPPYCNTISGSTFDQ